MKRLTEQAFRDLGGSTAIAELVKAPVSTVHSWRAKITESRLHHLRLAAAAAGKEIDWDTAVEDSSALEEGPSTAARSSPVSQTDRSPENAGAEKAAAA